MAVTDSFPGGNETPIAGNWNSGAGGWGNVNLVSNAVQAGTTDTDVMAKYNAGSFSNDQYSQAKIVTFSTGTGYVGVSVRAQSDTDGSCYVLYAQNVNNRFEIAKQNASGASVSTTTLATITATPAVNDIIKLEATGTNPTTLKAYQNGTQIGSNVTDSSSPYNNGRPGVAFYSSTVANHRLDDWEGGDVGAAAGQPFAIRGQQIPGMRNSFKIGA